MSGPSGLPASIPSSETKLYKYSWERASFYAKGLYWAFWENTGTCEGQSGCLYYAASSDGLSWNTPVNVGVHITREDFSVATNSTHVFYARFNETVFFSNTCNHALLFRAGTLGSLITWQSEQVVKPGDSTHEWLNPDLKLDTNNQAWIGFSDDDNSACGGTGVQVPAVVQSQGTGYSAWSPETVLTTAHNRSWAVDLAALPDGRMYAIYWLQSSLTADLHGRIYNGTWQPDEQVSPAADILDTDAFVFSSGSKVYAVWLDTTTRNLSFNARTPFSSGSGTWGSAVRIARSECCSNSAFYPVPWTAGYDSSSSSVHIYWYNYTQNRIDLYSGLANTWIGPSIGWGTNQADQLASLSAFQYSAPVGVTNTIGILFIDASTTSTPSLKFTTDMIDPPTVGGARFAT